MFTLKVTHGKFSHEVKVPSSSTIGDLKKVLIEEVFLRPEDQLLLFRGRQVADDETLEAAGILDRSKLMLLETGVSHERKNVESREKKEVPTAGSAVSAVTSIVDTYAAQVKDLEASVSQSKAIGDKEIALLQELLMRQLLKLDAIEAEGEVKQQRRNEVKRVSFLVEDLDRLKGIYAQQKKKPPGSQPTHPSPPLPSHPDERGRGRQKEPLLSSTSTPRPPPQLSSLSVSTSSLRKVSLSKSAAEGGFRSPSSSPSPSFADSASTFLETSVPFRTASSSPPAPSPNPNPNPNLKTRPPSKPTTSNLSSLSPSSKRNTRTEAQPPTSFPQPPLPTRTNPLAGPSAGGKGMGQGPSGSHTRMPPPPSTPPPHFSSEASRASSAPPLSPILTPTGPPAAAPIPNIMDAPSYAPPTTTYPSIYPSTSWLADISPPLPHPPPYPPLEAPIVRYDPSMGQVSDYARANSGSNPYEAVPVPPPYTTPSLPSPQPSYPTQPPPVGHPQHLYNEHPHPQPNLLQTQTFQYPYAHYPSGPYLPSQPGYPGHQQPSYPHPPSHPNACQPNVGLYPPSRMSGGQPQEEAEWEKFLPPR